MSPPTIERWAISFYNDSLIMRILHHLLQTRLGVFLAATLLLVDSSQTAYTPPSEERYLKERRSRQCDKVSLGGGDALGTDIPHTSEEEGGVGLALSSAQHAKDSTMTRKYLNSLVYNTVAESERQLTNIAFMKTHKTASTTLAAILYRYGLRHHSRLAHFEGCGSAVSLEDAVAQTEKTQEKVDIMHYHISVFGDYLGTWQDAGDAYRKIMRDPDNINFITLLREPRDHLLSYYYYFIQPHTLKSIDEFVTDADSKLDDHNHKRITNPLASEFGVKTDEEMEQLIENALPNFTLIMLTERFEEGLLVLRRLLKWNIIDVTYVALMKTKAGKRRYDGKPLVNVPQFETLRPEVQQYIDEVTKLDRMLYAAAEREFDKRYAPMAEDVNGDMGSFLALQALTVEYLASNRTSPASNMYRGNNVYLPGTYAHLF